MKRKLVFFLALMLLVPACGGVLSREALYRVNNELDYAQVKADPQAHEGVVLLLGGKIVENRATQGGSDLEVLRYTLGGRDMPRDPDEVSGRFMAKASRFLDPAIYEKGRLVTLAGALTGTETRSIGERPFVYLVFRIEEIYLWPEPYRSYPYEEPFYPYDHFHSHFFWYR